MEDVNKLTVVNVKKFPLKLYRGFKSVCVERGWSVLEGTVRAYNLLIESERGQK